MLIISVVFVCVSQRQTEPEIGENSAPTVSIYCT